MYVLNCIIEGLQATGAVGLHLIDGNRNWFIGGTIEANQKQIEVDAICFGNLFLGMYCELASSGIAMTIRGQWTQFQNCMVQAAGVGGGTMDLESGATHTVVVGGQLGTLNIKSGASDTCLLGPALVTLTDNGTRTHRSGVYNWNTSLPLADTASAFVLNGGPITAVSYSGAGGQKHVLLGNDPANQNVVFFIGGTERARFGASGNFNLASGTVVQVNGTQVLTSRRTGWSAPTGTATRLAFATSSVTLPQLAERVKALIDDLTTHGVIGA